MSESSKYPPHRDSTEELNEVPPLAPADVFDPVIEAYKKDVDRTILRENLKLSPQERSEKFVSFMNMIYEIRGKANPEMKVWR